MRPAFQKCVSSQLGLLDFLAPRLYAPSRTRFLKGNASRQFVQISTARGTSTGATARATATATKPSILDAASDLEGDFSYYAAHLYRCVVKRDLLGVWYAYERIHPDHRRVVLGPEHYGATSMMLVKQFDHILTVETKTNKELYAMEELAFACASAGFVDGLRQMMVWRLVKMEPEKVISAFERFGGTLLLDESGLEKAAYVSDAVESEENAELRLANPDISRWDVANIMAVTIAAYAEQDRFHDAVQFTLKYPSYRVTGDNIETLEEELKACGMGEDLRTAVETRTRKYIDAGGLAVLVQRPEAFKSHIRNLLKEREANPKLEKLRGKLAAAFSGEFPWAAATEAQRSPTRPIVIPEKIWADLIHSYLRLQDETSAKTLWADVIRWGRNPRTDMWNALLEGHRDNGHLQKLLRTWQAMRKQGIPYDARSYGAKLGCLVLDREAEHYSLKLFDEFKATKPSHEESLFVYNTVLNSLLVRYEERKALVLFKEMKTSGPRPDIVSYNTLITYHAKRRKPDLRAITGYIRELTDVGIDPDVFTFTTILSALLKARIPSAAERLLSIMDMMGVKQNVATVSAIIDSQVRRGTKSGVTSAWQVLQQLERMKDVQPNIVTYTSFLAGLHRSQELEKSLISSISSDVVQKMQKRGIRMRLGTYHILLKACLENPNAEALDFFMDYYNMMRRNGVPLWHDSWYIILDGLVRRGEWEMACTMKNQMLDSGFQPMWGVARKMRLIEDWEEQSRAGFVPS